jgi:hypothetical protein
MRTRLGRAGSRSGCPAPPTDGLQGTSPAVRGSDGAELATRLKVTSPAEVVEITIGDTGGTGDSGGGSRRDDVDT